MAERKQLGIVVHACGPSTLGAEAGGLPWFPGQPGLYKKSLSQEVEGWGGDGWEGRRERERRKGVDLSLLGVSFVEGKELRPQSLANLALSSSYAVHCLCDVPYVILSLLVCNGVLITHS